jgi:hypothetical protein
VLEGETDALTMPAELVRVQRAITPSAESQAFCFLLYNYVPRDLIYWDPLLDYFVSTKTSDSGTLSAIGTAVGMAGLSNMKRDTNLSILARQK